MPAALVTRPRLHLIRFHGVLAPNVKLRAQGVSKAPEAPAQEAKPQSRKARRVRGDLCPPPTRLSWAKLLKRVFDIDMEHYPGDREDPHAGGSGLVTRDKPKAAPENNDPWLRRQARPDFQVPLPP
jgi:hypothetical protein